MRHAVLRPQRQVAATLINSSRSDLLQLKVEMLCLWLLTSDYLAFEVIVSISDVVVVTGHKCVEARSAHRIASLQRAQGQARTR